MVYAFTKIEFIDFDTENLENCQYRGTYSNAGMKIEMFAPVKRDDVSNNDFMSFIYFEEEALVEYVMKEHSIPQIHLMLFQNSV